MAAYGLDVNHDGIVPCSECGWPHDVALNADDGIVEVFVTPFRACSECGEPVHPVDLMPGGLCDECFALGEDTDG